MLALVKPWFDDARVGLSVARVDVERCRNGYAQVHVVPRNDPGSPSAFDSVELFLQARDGRWHGLDFGTDVGCGSTPTAEVAKACKALGYGS
jgi:hypothetical protein